MHHLRFHLTTFLRVIYNICRYKISKYRYQKPVLAPALHICLSIKAGTNVNHNLPRSSIVNVDVSKFLIHE